MLAGGLGRDVPLIMAADKAIGLRPSPRENLKCPSVRVASRVITKEVTRNPQGLIHSHALKEYTPLA